MFGNIQKHKMKNKPLSREFLLNRGFSCGNGCLNCPYMENKTKKENRKNKKGNQKEGCGAETTGVFRMDPLSVSRRSGSSSARDQ